MSRALLLALAEREVLALSELAWATDGSSRADLRELLELGQRLPSGFVWAESVWILADRPGVPPLGPGSHWHALERSLAVVLPPRREALLGLLADLGAYARVAERVRQALGERGDLLEALEAPALTSEQAAELALLLDAPCALVEELDQRAPALRAELAEMARRGVETVVRVHASLSRATLRQAGRRLAEEILERLPDGAFRLLLSDGSLALEHLSPYVRDLGFALATWGLENSERLTTPGLAPALLEAAREPGGRARAVDLAALVVRDLLTVAPELLPERREAEKSAGLEVLERGGAVAAFAELSRLDLPDEAAVPPDAVGSAVVLAGGSEDLLEEALTVLLDSGRLTGCACVLAGGFPQPPALLPELLLDEREALRLGEAKSGEERARALGIEVRRSGRAQLGDRGLAPSLAGELLARVRRAKLLGQVAEDAPQHLILYPRGSDRSALGSRLAELDAGRLAASLLFSREDPSSQRRAPRGLSQNAPVHSRRFRA